MHIVSAKTTPISVQREHSGVNVGTVKPMRLEITVYNQANFATKQSIVNQQYFQILQFRLVVDKIKTSMEPNVTIIGK